MKKAVVVLTLAAVVTAFFGCAGPAVNKEAFGKIKYAGILSLTVKKASVASPGNEQVIQEVANYAVGQVEAALKSVRSFKVVSVSALAKVPEYYYAGTVDKTTGALTFLKNNPDAMAADKKETVTSGDFMTALKAGLNSASKVMAAQNDPVGTAQKTLDSMKSTLAGAQGLPFIPYGVINNIEEGAPVTYVNGVRQGGGNEGLKNAMIAEAKAVCAKTRLDAVILVYVDTAADHPKGVYLITGGNRVAGTVRLNMTMLMIDKSGEVILDLDWPSMDDLCPLKLAQPSYMVTKWTGPKQDMVADMVMDLKDPSGVIIRDYKELVVDSAGKMVNDLRKAIGEIE